jgi:hypothetical protein
MAWRQRQHAEIATAAAQVGLDWLKRQQRARDTAVRLEEERRQKDTAEEVRKAREQSWKMEQEKIHNLHETWLVDLGLEDSKPNSSREMGKEPLNIKEIQEQKLIQMEQLQQHHDYSLDVFMAKFENEDENEDTAVRHSHHKDPGGSDKSPMPMHPSCGEDEFYPNTMSW